MKTTSYTTTGADGRFQFRGLQLGIYSVSADEVPDEFAAAPKFMRLERGQRVDDVKVTLGGRTLELTHARATAVAWDEFRSLPARERFEVATGLKPGAKSTDGGDTHAEREGER